MKTLLKLLPYSISILAIALLWSFDSGSRSVVAAQSTQSECTPQEREQELRRVQAEVMKAAPRAVESLEKAMQPDGPLAGYRLSHGYAVIAGGGAVPLDNINAKEPMPQLLLYAPSPLTSPENWDDFDQPDGPYRLVGWGYIAMYHPGENPPLRKCIKPPEWIVHEAGWHLKDGGMQLTKGAASEPPRPAGRSDIYFWHPQAWDIHFWAGQNGVPTISFHNPKAPKGGVELPEGSFFYLVNGRKQNPPPPYNSK